MSLLRNTKKLYGKLHLGMPLGINLRLVAETIDAHLTTIALLPQRFSYQKAHLRYFVHAYNDTLNNERLIEIPIIRYHLQRLKPKRLLEIGNVLSHYQPIHHLVVDKYEQDVYAINQDVITYTSAQPFDCIISISTLEHVGQDESTHDPEKAVTALRHLQTLLTESGILIVTVPIGHNRSLDEYLRKYAKKYPSQVDCYLRIGDHRWQHSSSRLVFAQQYGFPYPAANGVVIAQFRQHKLN